MAFTMTVAEIIATDTSGLLSKHASWERAPLGQIASVLNGAPFDSALFSSTNGIPLARIRDVLVGSTSTYYSGSYEDIYWVQSGDLLVGMDGDFNCALWASECALLNQRVCKITPNTEFIDKHFLVYALPGYLAAINANTPSVTVKHLSSKTIGEIELPLPPRADRAGSSQPGLLDVNHVRNVLVGPHRCGDAGPGGAHSLGPGCDGSGGGRLHRRLGPATGYTTAVAQVAAAFPQCEVMSANMALTDEGAWALLAGAAIVPRCSAEGRAQNVDFE
jgi:hypothetical protein